MYDLKAQIQEIQERQDTACQAIEETGDDDKEMFESLDENILRIEKETREKFRFIHKLSKNKYLEERQ